MLGLAQRAGALRCGADPVLQQIRAGKAALVLMDSEASANTRKRAVNACAHYGVPLAELPAGLPGSAVGKPGVMLAAVQSGGFAEKLAELCINGAEQSETAPREE